MDQSKYTLNDSIFTRHGLVVHPFDLVFFAVCVVGVILCFIYLSPSTGNIKSSLKPSLKESVIIGSHDSLTGEVTGPLCPYIKTTDYSLEQQLKRGIRFFDLRGYVTAQNKIDGCHSSIPLLITFEEAFKILEQFVTDNPEEFLIVSIKEDKTSKGTKSFTEIVDEMYSDKWYLEGSLPDSVVGSILLINRYSQTKGVLTQWQDNASFSTNGLLVEDKYKDSVENKITSIENMVKEESEDLKLCFTSLQYSALMPIASKALRVNKAVNALTLPPGIWVGDYY